MQRDRRIDMSLLDRYYTETLDEQGIVTGIDIHYDEHFNFAYDVVDAIAEATPHKRALVYQSIHKNVREFTFADVKEQSNRIANVLLSKGVKAGDSVLLIMKRHFGFWMAVMALHKIGAVAIPTSHMVSGEDIHARIVKAQAKAIICVRDKYIHECVVEAVDGLACAPHILTVQRENEEEENIFFGEDLYELMAAASPNLPRIITNVTDPILYYFTSGTSGEPKAVVHNHAYPIAHIYTAKRWHGVIDGGLHLTVADSGWAKSAWGKMYGQWFCECAVMVYDYDHFFAADLLKLISNLGVTSFCAPPTIYKYLIREKLDQFDLSRVMQAVTAGEPMPSEVARRFKEQTGLEIREGFGQTETTLLACTPVGVKQVAGSIGKASPLYQLQIIGEDGEELPNGESGELIILPAKSGPTHGVFSGYLGNEEKYKEVWKNGVYHTCDKLHMDEEGNLFFEGRIDDVIKSSGYRIGPSEVEDIIMRHPAVVECAVTAYPSKTRGSIVKATVVLREGYEGDNAMKTALQDFVKEHAAIYKYPRMVQFVDALPKTFNGKISRKQIKEADEAAYYGK